MAVAESLITAVVVAGVLGLIKAIDYLLSKREGSKGVLTDSQSKQLEESHRTVRDIKERGTLTRDQEGILRDTNKRVGQLHEMHAVYDDNHVPRWYVPNNLSERLVQMEQKLALADLHMEELKASQAALIEKISDLITSQHLMTQRVGDLVSKLGRNS